MNKIMPILKPYDFTKDNKFFYTKPLFENSNSPLIVLAIDRGNVVEYLQAKSEEEYKNNFQELFNQALKNLKEINTEISISEIDHSKIAFITHEEYASEKIIDKEFMELLSKKLNADRIMVGIPFKGILIAIDYRSKLRYNFPATIKKYFQNPPNPPITSNIFLIEKGEIIAMGGEDIDNSEENFKIIEVLTSNNYKVEIKCDSLEDPKDLVNKSYQQVISMILDKKVSGGQISYYISGNINFSNELINKCNRYIDSIKNNEVANLILKTVTGKSINVEFYYNNNKIASNI